MASKTKKKPPPKDKHKGKKQKANQIKKKKDAKKGVGKSKATLPPKSPAPTTTSATKLDKPTGLGDAIDKEIAKSSKFKNKLKSIQSKGYTVKYGEPGKGSYCEKSIRVIYIDPNQKANSNYVLQTLAHEFGHADYDADPYVPLSPNGCTQPVGGVVVQCPKNPLFNLTREQFAAMNAERSLKDEGEATLTNIELAEDLKKNGGPDIGVAGSQVAKYKGIANKYPDSADRDKARKEIGEVFAKYEHPSTDPTKTYEQYYQAPYETFYDVQVATLSATTTIGGKTTQLNPKDEDIEIKPKKSTDNPKK